MKCSLGISNFSEDISSLSHSIFSFYFFALITDEGSFISPCYSLELCIQMFMSFFFSFAFHFSLSCLGEENGNPLQCPCLENPRDGGALWAAVYGVAQSRTQLK